MSQPPATGAPAAGPTGPAVRLSEIAEACGARLLGPPDAPATALRRVGPLDGADASTLTFVRSAAYLDRYRDSDAGAALVTPEVAEAVGDRAPAHPMLVVDDTDLALAAVLPLFADDAHGAASPRSVHPDASVDPSADVHPTAGVGPGCRVGPRARVGPDATLMANAVVGAGASVGASTTLHPGVVLGDRCSIGVHCTVFANAVIGADGFNFRPAPDGAGLVKIPHIAGVRVGDHVEVGASSAIDRGKFEDTVIGDGTKIDNLVQIGHNCRTGRCCLICGRAGLSGSVTLGDGVVLAGGVGIADNLTIGDGATVGAGAGVMNDIPAGETWLGAPAQPVREAMANLNAFRSLSPDLRALRKQAKALAARLDALEAARSESGTREG